MHQPVDFTQYFLYNPPMEKIILVSDADTPLGYTLFNFFLNDGNKVAGTVSSIKKNIQIAEPHKEAAAIFEWGRSSPVESKNLLLSIIKKFKRLDEAILIQALQPGAPGISENAVRSYNTPLHETEISAIEKEIDYRIKGLLFLSREIIKTFTVQKKGFLFFVNNFYYADEISVLRRLIETGITSFLKELMKSYRNSGIMMNVIESAAASAGLPADDEFASFVYKNITEKFIKPGGQPKTHVSGQYIHFRPSKNLFAGLGKVLKNKIK
jgi:hypothetical protein